MTSADYQERLDNLPSPRAAANAVELAIFDSATGASGKITMRQLEAAGAFSRKTILKHVRAGILPAEKATINGRTMWLFDPADVQKYLNQAATLLENAVRYKKNRPTRVQAPDGYMTLTEAAQQCAVSHWTLRAHLPKIDVKTTQGRHAVKMIRNEDLPILQSYFRAFTRPKPRRRAPQPPAKGRQTGGPYFENFDTLWAVLREQPEITLGELMHVTGADPFTIRRWLGGSRTPSAPYQGAIIALFRERFPCRLSEPLQDAATAHRRQYMARYMAAKREKPE